MFTLKNNLDSLLAALVGSAFIFILTNYHGIGMSPDSVSYAGVARNIRLGNGISEFNGNPLIIFPAGYPVFLGVMSWLFSHDILTIAPFINGALVGLVIFIHGCLIQHFTGVSKWYKWAILSLLPISFSILDVFTMLWSETLFLVLICFFILCLRKYLVTPNIKYLFLPALFTALACDTRIAGISIMATGLLLIFLHKKVKWNVKLLHLVIYSACGIFLLLLNLIRNDHENGTMTGVRQKSITSFWQNVQYFGETLLQWFRLPDASHAISIILATVVVLSLGLVFLYRYFKWEKMAELVKMRGAQGIKS